MPKHSQVNCGGHLQRTAKGECQVKLWGPAPRKPGTAHGPGCPGQEQNSQDVMVTYSQISAQGFLSEMLPWSLKNHASFRTLSV